jgi:hypothetical protein
MFAIRVIRFDSDFVIGLAIDFGFVIATVFAFAQKLLPTQKPVAPSQQLPTCG